MIEAMKPKSTFIQSEIQDGDVICFQVDLSEKEYVVLEWRSFLLAKFLTGFMIWRAKASIRTLPSSMISSRTVS
jgi:hypothetical protein